MKDPVPDALDARRKCLLEAESFDPVESTYEILVELTHSDESEEVVAQARALLSRFFDELERK